MADAETKDLLRRIARSVEVRTVGTINDAPGSRTIFANVSSAPGDALWYFWDHTEKTAIPLEKRNVRGQLVNAFAYEKTSSRGTSTKVRIALDCGLTSYEIETSFWNESNSELVTSGKMLIAALTGTDPSGTPMTETIHNGGFVTIGARPASDPEMRDKVLFMHAFSDAGRSYHDGLPESKEEALAGIRKVREALALTHNPYDNRISNRDEPHEGSSNGGHNTNQGDVRPDEELYRGQNPPKRGRPAEGGKSAANPSGDPRTSGSKNRKRSNGHTPAEMLDEGDPREVVCSRCEADPGEPCYTLDDGTKASGFHDTRRLLARGLAGDPEALLEVIRPFLENPPSDGLDGVINDVAEQIGRWPEESWEEVVTALEGYHDKARSLCVAYREPPS